LSGDVFSRYYKLRGEDVLYVSGTDAHGTRLEFEAEKLGTTPEKLVKKNHAKIVKIIKDFEIEFDNYSITTSEKHKEFVKDIYTKIEKNGFITTKTEKRAFCKSCEKFLADSFIIGKCPKCEYAAAKGNQCDQCSELLEPEELQDPNCAFCKKKDIVFKETKHWYLDLKKLEPELKKYVNKHKDWPNNVRKFTENFLKKGLIPRAITRDIKWGIPAPFEGAEWKVIYVWAEAALGYVSATKELGDKWKDFWFGDKVKQIYTIGKDNIPFHTIFFPAQLIGSKEGYHLPFVC
jgi:methionyl-tRNA synthetase